MTRTSSFTRWCGPALAILAAILLAGHARELAAQQPARTVLSAGKPTDASPSKTGHDSLADERSSQRGSPQGRGQQGKGQQGVGPGGVGSRGGSAQADFDTLIDLIQSTVAPDSWEENGTGQGSVMPFDINGVYVDAAGQLRFTKQRFAKPASGVLDERSLASVAAQQPPMPGVLTKRKADARQPSKLRYVSLNRLEAAIEARQQQKLPLEVPMLTLAGLQRVEYVLAYPAGTDGRQGDLVLAGPAGDWRAEAGRLVSADTGQPLVRLDDLLAIWRLQRGTRGAAFGCSIIPRQESLAATQAYLQQNAAQLSGRASRKQWLAGLQKALGEQDVEFYQISPETRVARLLLLADYHMKLVGMGLAEGTPGVESYLDTVQLDEAGAPPAMSILRWWFALGEAPVEKLPAGHAYRLPESCVRVLSENELLAARGKRVHTGQSDELNQRFARSFSEQYTQLAEKYPIYGELQRVFELALAVEIVRSQSLIKQSGWQPSVLLDAKRLGLPRVDTPRTVDTVINHRVLDDRKSGQRHVIAGVSGGVWIDASKRPIVPVSASTGDQSVGDVPVVTPQPTAAEGWWWD